MAKFLKAMLSLLIIGLLASQPAVASAQPENNSASGITLQQTAPSVTDALNAAAELRLNSPVPVPHTFSEPVSGFSLSDVVVVNGTASNLVGSGAVYTLDVIPAAASEVTVDIAAGVDADSGGDGSTVAPQQSPGLAYDLDGNGLISRAEAITAIRDYFDGRITRPQVIEVIRLYFSPPTEPESMVSQEFMPGKEVMVEHPSGAMIEVPQDATAAPGGEGLMVSVEEMEPPGENVLPVGQVFDFSVVDQDGDDVPLREPVKVTLPYSLPEGKDADDVVLMHWDDRLGIWEGVDSWVVDEGTETVSAEVEDLSELTISWYLRPIEFIAVAAFALVGGTVLQADYDLGYKHLVSFHVNYGFRPPMFPVAKIGKVGGSLVFDLDDLASLPLVQGTVEELVDLEPITVEGGDNFVTFWLNLHASASLELDPLAGAGSGDVGRCSWACPYPTPTRDSILVRSTTGTRGSTPA